MDVSSLFIADNSFEQKVKELKTMLRLRMNGETSAQMKRRKLHYALNYGASLPHIKEIASKVSFTAEECRLLWMMNIRETMLLACMLMPEENATVEECALWVSKINTPDMAEQSAFFLFGRIANAGRVARRILEEKTPYSLAVACFTLGRALQLKKELDSEIVGDVIDVVLKCEEYTVVELRGLSLLLRQLVRLIDVQGVGNVQRTLDHLEKIDTQEAQRVVYEVNLEKEMM